MTWPTGFASVLNRVVKMSGCKDTSMVSECLASDTRWVVMSRTETGTFTEKTALETGREWKELFLYITF